MYAYLQYVYTHSGDLFTHTHNEQDMTKRATKMWSLILFYCTYMYILVLVSEEVLEKMVTTERERERKKKRERETGRPLCIPDIVQIRELKPQKSVQLTWAKI